MRYNPSFEDDRKYSSDDSSAGRQKKKHKAYNPSKY